ncbi:metal-dependent hydrolase [Halobaculum sp. CBA1158]|uniref:metal-dependent hydrolase n=1 Tax=Halobaculum sp. CBA1158 TaxID=2904243 RepID=UPI001F35E288|nr:metal-dependent hydrolase [Halobaculum sp. CBA1158]UIO99745.1 metal-dependent hydrolase [Halobaculum sp. CBA1158]
MPSLLVHLALAALFAGILLDRAFDARSLAVVLAAVSLPDLDAVVALAVPGTHRAALHTLLFPLALAALLLFDCRRERSTLRARYGDRGVRIASVSVLAIALAGILPDLAHTGVNLLYPIHDRFYTVDGTVLITTHRGLVGDPGIAAAGWIPPIDVLQPDGTTNTTHHPSPLDPTMGADPLSAERKIWVVGDGIRLVLVVSTALVVAIRLAIDRRARR